VEVVSTPPPRSEGPGGCVEAGGGQGGTKRVGGRGEEETCGHRSLVCRSVTLGPTANSTWTLWTGSTLSSEIITQARQQCSALSRPWRSTIAPLGAARSRQVSRVLGLTNYYRWRGLRRFGKSLNEVTIGDQVWNNPTPDCIEQRSGSPGRARALRHRAALGGHPVAAVPPGGLPVPRGRHGPPS
jgi:hypothetical protein